MRPRLTHANVTATLAPVLATAVSGTTDDVIQADRHTAELQAVCDGGKTGSIGRLRSANVTAIVLGA